MPTFIPKPERDLYRDALIALHGGKTLAALFYLRTFIEVFARRQTKAKGRLSGEELMTAYASTLSRERRDHMPSLADWYGKLSEALHEAREDPDLFEEGNAAILEHFDFRRLFKIADAGATGKS